MHGDQDLEQGSRRLLKYPLRLFGQIYTWSRDCHCSYQGHESRRRQVVKYIKLDELTLLQCMLPTYKALTSVSDFHGVVGDAGKVLPPCYKEGPWSPSEMRSFKWLKQFISEGLQELAQQSRNQQTGCIMRNPSTATLPPTYEALMGASGSRGVGGGAGEIPPPSYEEAMFLIGDDKLQVVLEDSKYTASSDDELSKELCAGATGRKPQQGSTAD
uniref:Uncharacterized protein n=1 Tax=Timema poppense TaxID=170557 RepID=A0A7R9CW13_TIMPO|nr:unnamed protein product [Timema poppensis]